MSFDSRCYDLASVFCQGEPTLDNEAKRNELAQLIQTTIEDWIAFGSVTDKVDGGTVYSHLPYPEEGK